MHLLFLQLTVGRGAPLPITEEGSHLVSSHQPDTSIDSGDFHIVKKKPPKKPASLVIESSDDQDTGALHSPSKRKIVIEIGEQFL